MKKRELSKKIVDKKELREKAKAGDFELCVAAELERQAEKISMAVVKKVLLEGRIFQRFPQDPRGPSMLIERKGRKSIHVMCAVSKEEGLRILAIYHPSKPKWFR